MMETATLMGGERRHVPLPGQGRDRSDPTYVVETDGLGGLPQPVIYRRLRRLTSNRQ